MFLEAKIDVFSEIELRMAVEESEMVRRVICSHIGVGSWLVQRVGFI